MCAPRKGRPVAASDNYDTHASMRPGCARSKATTAGGAALRLAAITSVNVRYRTSLCAPPRPPKLSGSTAVWGGRRASLTRLEVRGQVRKGAGGRFGAWRALRRRGGLFEASPASRPGGVPGSDIFQDVDVLTTDGGNLGAFGRDDPHQVNRPGAVSQARPERASEPTRTRQARRLVLGPCPLPLAKNKLELST